MKRLPNDVLKNMSKEDLILHINQLYHLCCDQETAMYSKTAALQELRRHISNTIDSYESDITFLHNLNYYNDRVHDFEHTYEKFMPKPACVTPHHYITE